MLSINWFRLIFIIKLIIITLATIQGAPIDLIEPPVSAISPNNTQIHVATFENFITEYPLKLDKDNHVESHTINDLLTEIVNLNVEQLTLTASQQEVTTETGNSFRVHQTTTPLTHMEVTGEKTKESENSQNINEILQNTTERNLPQIGNSTNETSTQTSSPITEVPVITLKGELLSSTTALSNTQNTQTVNLIRNNNLTQQTTNQINFGNNGKPQSALETEFINSQTKTKNTQNTTEGSLPRNENSTEGTTQQTNWYIREIPLITIESGAFNPQTKADDSQTVPEAHLIGNQNVTLETTKQVNSDNNEKFQITVEKEKINSQTTLENTQNTTEENQNLTEETTKQVNFVTSENALEKESINSQTTFHNTQLPTKENVVIIQNLSTKQENFVINETPFIALEKETINPQTTNGNTQNVKEETYLEDTIYDTSTTKYVNLDNIKQSAITLESENINSQNENENSQITTTRNVVENTQNPAEGNLLQNTNLTGGTTEHVNLDNNKLLPFALESENIYSQNENVNFQNTTEINLLKNQSSTKETTTQINFATNGNPLIALESEIVNSQTVHENLQNTTVENSPENENLANETSRKAIIDIPQILVNAIESEIINSQVENENPLKIPESILAENQNLTAEITTQLNFVNTENPRNSNESKKFNSESEKDNRQNTTEENSTENQSSVEKISSEVNVFSIEKPQIRSGSEILNFQDMNENLQIGVLKENNELNGENVKQSILPHEIHGNDNNLNFFTQNINIQKLTDQIEESVKTIVKESEEKLGKKENSETKTSEFLNEYVQYFEPNEKAENGSLNEKNVTEKRMEEQKYNSENESINSPNHSDNNQNSNNNFIIEQREVKSVNKHEQNVTNPEIVEATGSLSTSENTTDPIDLGTEIKQEQNIADSDITRSTNFLTTTENIQNSLVVMSDEESSTIEGFVQGINMHETTEATSDLSTAHTNSQNSTEYLQYVQISPSSQKGRENNESYYKINTENPQKSHNDLLEKNNEFEEQITTESTLHNVEKHRANQEVELIDSQLISPNNKNAHPNTLVESQLAVAQNVEKLKAENISLQNATGLSENMATQLLSGNAQTHVNESKLENVVAIKQILETGNQMEEKLSTVPTNVKQNLSNLVVNQISMTQANSTNSSEEETTEKILNSNTQQNIDVNSNAFLENSGFLTITENIDVTMDNLRTTNSVNVNDFIVPSSFNDDDSPKEPSRSIEGTTLNWNTEKSGQEITSPDVTATGSILSSSTGTETTNSERISVNPTSVEESTVSGIPKVPSSTQENIEFNLKKAFESILESNESNQSVEDTTIFGKLEDTISSPAAVTTTPFATTESAGDEATVTTSQDRNSYIRSTTNSQFASLLEETEMSVHKAFETLREWIATGKKIEEATKNPAQLEEVATTMKSDEETTKLPESTEFTTITESGEKKIESENTLNTSKGQDNEERTSTSMPNIEEVESSTLSTVLGTTIYSVVENFNNSIDKMEKLQLKEHIQIAQDENTTMTDLQENTTPISTNGNLLDVLEASTESDLQAAKVEPSLTRVKLQKDVTGINLTYLGDTSEEVVSENHIKTEGSMGSEHKIAEISKSQNTKDISRNRNIMNVKFFNKENTILYQPTPVTFYQEMVKFIERQTTESPKLESQTQVPLTQASFMQEQQQQIESTTESDIKSDSTTLDITNDITTLRGGSVNKSNTTTEPAITIELQPTNILSTTTELHSTMTELPTTTDLPATTKLHTTKELPATTDLFTTTEFSTTTEHILETTLTTEEDSTTTTDEPEIATTTLIVPPEPEGRSLALPPPKLEYLQNEDGVEVFYGYSIVKHN